MNRLRKLSLIALSCLTSIALADDTDIYINNNPPPGAAPLVMFVMDFRPNLWATICNDAGSGCPQTDFFVDFANNSLVDQQIT